MHPTAQPRLDGNTAALRSYEAARDLAIERATHAEMDIEAAADVIAHTDMRRDAGARQWAIEGLIEDTANGERALELLADIFAAHIKGQLNHNGRTCAHLLMAHARPLLEHLDAIWLRTAHQAAEQRVLGDVISETDVSHDAADPHFHY